MPECEFYHHVDMMFLVLVRFVYQAIGIVVDIALTFVHSKHGELLLRARKYWYEKQMDSEKILKMSEY